MKRTTLDKLKINESGTVCSVEPNGAMQRRMLELGFVKGTRVECVGKAPSGDPSAYLVRGAVIALRADDAAGIALDTMDTAETDCSEERENNGKGADMGIGEDGYGTH